MCVRETMLEKIKMFYLIEREKKNIQIHLSGATVSIVNKKKSHNICAPWSFYFLNIVMKPCIKIWAEFECEGEVCIAYYVHNFKGRLCSCETFYPWHIISLPADAILRKVIYVQNITSYRNVCCRIRARGRFLFGALESSAETSSQKISFINVMRRETFVSQLLVIFWTVT